jgi:hypothetical protein
MPGIAAPKKQQTASEYLKDRIPRLVDLPESAPVYDGIAKPSTFPVVAGCVVSPSKGCVCYSQQGTWLSGITLTHFQAVVAHGYFDPYRNVKADAAKLHFVPTVSGEGVRLGVQEVATFKQSRGAP